MKKYAELKNGFGTAARVALGSLAIVTPALADTTVNTFDYFHSDALYASWATATIDEGATAYTVTSSGYGSNWKYNPFDGTGHTNVQLTVTLSGAAGADGALGPIVTLEDADGTSYNFAWYGQTLGQHLVLNKALNSPTWIGAAGSTPGLNLATLTHLHMQIDPSSYAGTYTISWEDLRLTGAPPPAITAKSYNPTTHEFTLTWTSLPGKSYTILQTSSLATAFTPLTTDIPSDGATTTTTVTMPAADAGFLRVQEQ